MLMQGVPMGLDLQSVRDGLQTVPGVKGIHDLHVWSLGSRQTILTAHVVLTDPAADPDVVRTQVAQAAHAQFDIDHSTLQVERSPCRDATAHA